MPEKTFDIKFLRKDSINSTNKKEIIETSKYIKDFSQIKNIVASEDDKKIDDFFQNKKWASEFFNTINLTLCFNPLSDKNNKETFDSFLEYLYSHSNSIVTIPSITNKIISIDDYIKFIDYCYDFLKQRNSKSLFVPISMRMSMDSINKLIEHYRKKEYYYIWFDFEGKAINKNTSARINRIRRLLEPKDFFKESIFYFTNIKREILSNIKSQNTSSSDILSSIGGANIIGINREPQKFNPNAKTEHMDQQEIWKHKARFFDSDSYYYKKFDEGKLEPKNINITNNSNRIMDELKKQTEVFLEKLKIKDYIIKKPMISENPFISKLLLN
ncbi:MAG: hypothetical protein WC812_02680 [Candidatus Pacearchaeota archaeon]|jgi:hypothetical protein